jgi:phosphoribosylaminoimidazolecarboxamide formyltransferase/IMP cyclohydrolase
VRFENAIENIDIGGPAMVRAAAKNYLNCTVLTSPNDYNYFINNYNTQKISNEGINKKMSLRAFQYVAHYDICIANYLEKEIEGESFPKFHTFKKISNLRYGENPHQKASLFQNYNEREVSIVNSKTLQGKELSFNNIVDGDTALSCVINFEKPSCVIVKHANPCGVSSDNNLQDAYKNAYLTDSVSAFGGVIAFNSEVNEELMKSILDNQFVELIIAPLFSGDSLEYAKTKKNVRIIEYVDYKKTDFNNAKQIKNISDGILMQDLDHSKEDKIEKYKVVSKRLPTQKELDDLGFAWVVAKYVKSNAIVFAKNKKTLGVGAGQMSRIDSTFIASKKAEQENLSLNNAVMASDAFFPFSDNVEKAAELGIKAIIQPGGSKNDQEVIDKANELNLSLVFTGIRHFRH